MKYEWFRLLRDWTFWFLLLLSVTLVVGYSAVYFKMSETTPTTWYYSVSDYQNDEDIADQLELTQNYIAEVEFLLQSGQVQNSEDLQEDLHRLQSSEKILRFLSEKSDEYPYQSLCDGCTTDAYSKNRRSYGTQVLEVVFLFQIVSLIFLIGQIVNQGKTSGTFVFSMVMRKRKTTFFRQAAVSLLVFSISYLIQVGMIAAVRGLLNGDIQNVLMFDGETVRIIGESTEFLFLCLSLYLILLTFWAIVFFLSQVVDNVLNFSVVSLLVCAVLFLLVIVSNNALISNMHTTITDIMTESISSGTFVLVFLLRFLCIAGCLVGAYWVSQKKEYRIRYE